MRIPAALRQAFRGRRTAAAVLLCTAIGMAATAAVVTLLDLAMRPQAAFPHAERLVRVWNTEVGSDARDELSWAEFIDIAAHVDAFESVEAAARARLVWHLDGRAGRRVEGEAVSPGYLGALGVRPTLGRTFAAGEQEQGAPVMLIAHATWQREFGGAPDVVGRSIEATTQAGERAAWTVIGVLPAGFGGTIEEDMPDIEYWVPANAYLAPDARADRRFRSTWLLARLAPGAGLSQARAQIDALATRLAPQLVDIDSGHAFLLERFGASWSAPYRQASPVLMAAGALLLAIAAFNVFLLMLSRTLDQGPQLALRAALGASRARLLRGVALQGVALTAAGGVLGIVLAPTLLRGVLALGELDLPAYVNAWPSVPALAVSLLALLAVALVASTLPAALLLRRDPAATLAGGARNLGEDGRRFGWQRRLVSAQLGIAVALLVGAAALGQAWMALDATSLGFDTAGRLRMALFISPEDAADPAELPALIERIDARLRTEPGVRDVAWVWPTVPLLDAVPVPIVNPAFADAGGSSQLDTGGFVVRAGFFGAMGVPLLSGRDFDARDDADAGRVAIVSRSVAESFGGPERALNQRIAVGDTEHRIIGVVGDTRFGGADERAGHAHELYLHFDQAPRRLLSPIVRVAGDPVAQAGALTRVLGEMAPQSAVDWVDPVDTFTGWLLREHRFRFLLLTLFAGSALVLAAAGLYGLLSQQVVRRTREFGLRKALGASGRNILLRVLGGATRLVAAGLVAGAVLAILLLATLRGVVQAGIAVDVRVAVAVVVVLCTVALLACIAPALRAARVAPMQALRHD